MEGEKRVPCDDSSIEEGRHCLTSKDRERIMARIHSALFWVGELIPDRYVIDGKDVPLRDTIFRFISDEDVGEEDVRKARELAEMLEREARRLEKELKNDDSLSRRDAHVVLDEVLGLLRAVDELRGLDKERGDLKKRALMEKVDDEKRWLRFVQQFNR